VSFLLLRPLRRAALPFALACAALLGAAHAQGTAEAQRARPVILVVGDSLSAEYGLPRGSGWVQLLDQRLREARLDYTVVNASISGDTTSGGRTRLPALLKEHRPAIVILELGANDGLRGLPLPAMRDNLVAMTRTAQQGGARVLLVGVRVPPNYGRDYAERFFDVYPAVAKDTRAALAPFLLDGFAESTEFFQPDRIHPSVAAQPRMLDNVWPHLKPLLASAPAGKR